MYSADGKVMDGRGRWREPPGEGGGGGVLTVIGMRMLRLETATEATTVAATMITGRSPGTLAGAASLGGNQDVNKGMNKRVYQDVHLSKSRRCTILLQLKLGSALGCFVMQCVVQSWPWTGTCVAMAVMHAQHCTIQ